MRIVDLRTICRLSAIFLKSAKHARRRSKGGNVLVKKWADAIYDDLVVGVVK